MYIYVYDKQNIGYMWRGIKTNPRSQEFYRAGIATPGFEIPGSATAMLHLSIWEFGSRYWTRGWTTCATRRGTHIACGGDRTGSEGSVDSAGGRGSRPLDHDQLWLCLSNVVTVSIRQGDRVFLRIVLNIFITPYLKKNIDKTDKTKVNSKQHGARDHAVKFEVIYDKKKEIKSLNHESSV